MTIIDNKWSRWLLLGLILGVATFLHVWRLPEFPAAISGDEAYNGVEALLLMQYPAWIIYAPSNSGREALFHYVLMLPVSIFGPTIFALRIVPALASLLIIPLTYSWLRSLYPGANPWIGVLAAALIATSLWTLQLSRLGLRGILLVPCMLAAYYFFWRGYTRNQSRDFVISGLWLGLTVHTYTASRSLPLVFILFVIYVLAFHRATFWTAVRGLVITGVASLVVFAPLGWYFWTHPYAFLHRSQEASLWYHYQIANYTQTYLGSFPDYVLARWLDHLLWFGETIQLGWFGWGLLLVGLGLVRVGMLARREAGYAFLLISFGVGVMPLAVGTATTMRIVAALPATYVLMAIGVLWLLDYMPWRSTLSAVLVTIVLIAGTGRAYDAFHVGQWIGQLPLPTPLDYGMHRVGQRVKSLVRDEGRRVLMPYTAYSFSPNRFLFYGSMGPPRSTPPPTNPSGPIAVIWPANWQRWFTSQSPGFVLLSPQGEVERVGVWEASQFEALRQAIAAQPDAELVIDDFRQPLIRVANVDSSLVYSALRETPQHPIQLAFNNEITLTGYTLNLLDPAAEVTLFLQDERDILVDYHWVMQLRNSQGNIVNETISLLQSQPPDWYPGQSMLAQQVIPLTENDDSPGYVLRIGLVELNYRGKTHGLDGKWAATPRGIGLIPLRQVWRESPPSFDDSLRVPFGDKIELTGFHRTTDNRVWLRWEALRPLNADYTITVQLLDAHQTLVAQVDKPPFGGAYPTSTWLPGQPVIDVYALSLPETLSLGVYSLRVGVYHTQTLERLPATMGISNLVELEQLRVE